MYWPKPNSTCRSEAFRRFYWSLQATCRSCRPLLVTFQPKATTQSVLVTDNKCLPAEFNKERPGGQVASIYRYYCSPNR